MTVAEIARPEPTAVATSRRLRVRVSPYVVGLVIALAVAAPLHLLLLDREGYGNTYYAAAVKSMLTGWRTFFFASFDAGGFVTVDKPPLGLWLQAASAKLFGFTPYSLLVPQAIAGIAAVALLYHLVARSFGVVAGTLAAVALAVTPISVVTNRNNTSDGVLVLVLLGAVWATSIAAERGRLGLFLLGMALVGAGFNIKMLQAYLVLPPLVLVYLLGARAGWWRRVWHVAVGLAVLLATSLVWVVAVDLIPAASRPYIGSSGANSALSLTLGYNGLSRLTDSFFTRFPGLRLFSLPVDLAVAPAFAPGIGEPGVERLRNTLLAGQIGWLLPLAAFGLLVAAWHVTREDATPGRHRRRVAVALWGGWLVTVGGFFGVARFYHLYYLVMLAPAIAALVGIGATTLLRWYRAGGWRAWPLPPALALTAFAQAKILADYPTYRWLAPMIVGCSLIIAAALVIARIPALQSMQVAPAIWAGGLIVLLLAPTVWSAVSVRDGAGGAWLPQASPAGGQGGAFFGAARGAGPQAGSVFPTNGQFAPPSSGNPPNARGTGATAPQPATGRTFPTNGTGATAPTGGGPGGGFAFGRGGGALTFAGDQWDSLDPRLVAYLRAQQGDARFLVGTDTSSYASLFILASDQPALALGGYQGWDRIVTPAQLAQMVRDGAVRFFYLGAGGFGGGNVNADLDRWVRDSCAAVPAETWGGAAARGGFGQTYQLYDCGNVAAKG